MWLLSFVPDSILVHVVNAILILGAVATFLSYFVINRILRWFPPLAPYITFIQLLSAAVLLAGVYFKGSYQTEADWRARVAEAESRVAKAEAESQEANAKLAKAMDGKIKYIKGRTEYIKQYVDREVVKYDVKFAPGGQCEIPKEFIKALNDAAEPPK